MIDPGLAGRVVLVTGGNHGIGAATARAFAMQGARVLITFMRVPLDEALARRVAAGENGAPGEVQYAVQRAGSAEAIVQAIRAQGGQAAAWEVDLADPVSVPRLFEWAEKMFDPVDVLVNNAAHWECDTFVPPGSSGIERLAGSWNSPAPITLQSHDRHFAVNSRAVALLMAEFARRHRERGAAWGRIINLSTDGASGFRGEISYGASKHAMESFSRAAAGELRSLGITVNVVSPGPIQTGYLTSESVAALDGYVGQPEDVADVIVFLASEQARWLTGQLFYVGGGHAMPL